MYNRSKKDSWKSKHIKAMNRIISRSKANKETTEHYLTENNRKWVSNTKNKKKYKEKNK